MASEIELEIRKLKALKQYRDTPENLLEKQAQKNVTLRELLESGNFIDANEKKLAKTCFEKFLETNDFETYTDLQTLSTLVYNIILLHRVQKTINESTDKDGKSYVSDKMVKSMHDIENQILSLKVRLGLEKEDKQDDLSYLQLLKKRFHNWIQYNKNEFSLAYTYTCKKCGHQDVFMALLRRRVKDFDMMIHPFFSGRWYFCEAAIKDVEDGKLTKEQYATYFKTSIDYVNWCILNKGKILSSNKMDSL